MSESTIATRHTAVETRKASPKAAIKLLSVTAAAGR
jgi:hypothetical protein